MKFDGVMLRQKLYQKIIKHFMTSSCILGSVRVENNRKSELLCFHPICLKFGGGGGGGG